MKKSKGLGDTIEKITTVLKIPKCKPCDERRKALNNKFPYVRKMTGNEYSEWITFLEQEDEYSIENQNYIIDTLRYTTGIKIKRCKGCDQSSWRFWIDKINKSFTRS